MKNIYFFAFILFSLTGYSQSWEQVASLPDNFNTHHSFAFSIDDVGYMVAGTTLSGPSSAFYSYDAIADEWTKKEDFPGAARGFAIGDVWGGKAYFGFGSSASGSMDDFWEYDPSTDMWTQLASCDCDARTHPAMVALNGEIYVGMGGTSNGNSNDWWAYNIENNAWEERERFPGLPRHHPFQFTDGEYIYAGFGHGSGFISNQWYRYNTVTDTWLEVQTLPSEGRVAGTQMSYDGLGLILSGDGDDHGVMPTGEFWVYDPTFDSWTSLPPHPGVSRWAPTSFIINDEAYILNGERNGEHLTANYKFDISSLKLPNLNIATSSDPITFISTDDNCNSVHMKSIEVGSRVPFDVDKEVTIEIDPSSTAIEGDDFTLMTKTATLVAGETILNFELLLFDDGVVNEDRRLILNLVADADIGTDKIEIELTEDDIQFGTESVTRTIVVGEGSGESIAPFSRFYTNARSQMLYRSDLLKIIGVEAGPIGQIGFEVVSTQEQNFVDFTVSIAHTNLQQLVGNGSNGLALEEVFKGTFNSQNGINEIVFDTPFEYNGESNLVIQICFDNDDYTENGLTAATEVGYNSTVTVQGDFVNGCPSNGLVTSSNFLPNLFLEKDGFYPLFTRTNKKFQSEVKENESIYFSLKDSILAIVDNVNSVDVACMSAELKTNSNTINTTEDIDWIDKVYELNSENGQPSDYEVTLLVPIVEDIDFASENISGLFSAVDPTEVNGPNWILVEAISVVENEEYVSVKFPYQGSGFYAIGGVDLSTSTIEQELDLVFDQVTLYDAMGRILSSNSTEVKTDNLQTGIYFLVYSNKGEVLKTKKIFR